MSEIAILGPIITVWLRLPNLIILSFMDSEFVMSYDMFVLASGLSEAVSKYFQNVVLGYDNPSTKLYISRTSGSREFTSFALPKTSSILFFQKTSYYTFIKNLQNQVQRILNSYVMSILK